MEILGIVGSLRSGAHNEALMGAAALAVPEGAGIIRLDGLRDLPYYDEDQDTDSPPPAVVRLRARIAAADALLIATPEYNGSIPGVVKNAVDWASRPFPGSSLRGRSVAVIGASTSRFGGVWAHAELRKVLGLAGARVVASGIAVPHADRAFAADGRLADPEQQEALAAVLADLVASARGVLQPV
ncbi:MAG: NAD(P)H-dependent oxidoreductase [Thermoleophilia bacterium]|jgi:chromate reductase|nr:NAD(P)H-dependent oxidoreductase [Thermoleophilia bacterium]